jgi:hypothetical protein
MDRSVMQLRAEVGALLGRCVDEVKLIAFQRQLEVVESSIRHPWISGLFQYTAARFTMI